MSNNRSPQAAALERLDPTESGHTTWGLEQTERPQPVPTPAPWSILERKVRSMLKRTSLQQGSQLTALDSRKFPRKRVLFSGVITGPEAESPIDCTIRDISASGAQVQTKRTLTLRSRLYLIDTRNEAAHLAAVAWVRDHRLGLSFIHSHLLDVGLGPKLQFLRIVLVEAKLRQVRSLVKRSLSVEEATSLVGITENYLDHFADLSPRDEKTNFLLAQARRLLTR